MKLGKLSNLVRTWLKIKKNNNKDTKWNIYYKLKLERKQIVPEYTIVSCRNIEKLPKRYPFSNPAYNEELAYLPSPVDNYTLNF